MLQKNGEAVGWDCFEESCARNKSAAKLLKVIFGGGDANKTLLVLQQRVVHFIPVSVHFSL